MLRIMTMSGSNNRTQSVNESERGDGVGGGFVATIV